MSVPPAIRRNLSLMVLVLLRLSVSLMAFSYVPPDDVTIGICLSPLLTSYQETRAAIEFGRNLTNYDTSVIPSTDILTIEVDCGTTETESHTAAAYLLAMPQVIGIIGGQSEIQTAGIQLAAASAGKPFLALHTHMAREREESISESWMVRMSATDYHMASGFWDLYAAYLNPTLQENYPVPEAVQIHLLYSSDDSASVAMKSQLEFHGRFLGINFTSMTDLLMAGHSIITARDALVAVQAASPTTGNHTLWVISSTLVLPDLLTAAAVTGVLDSYLWVLSEASVTTITSALADSQLRQLSHGMIGLVRAKGYVAQDRMFSPYPYLDLEGNYFNWSGFTNAQYGIVYDYPTYETQCAFDAIGTFARSLTQLLATASDEAVYQRGDLILAQLINVSYVGASGPITFTSSGDRKTVRFDVVQLLQEQSDAQTIGFWSPLTGASLVDDKFGLFNRAIGGNWFLDPPYERVDLAYSSVGFAYTWNSIPVQSAPPPLRYGSCVVVSKSLDALVVLHGTASSNSVPYSDVWSFSFVLQQWKFRPTSGVKPDPRFYAGCSIDGDYVYVFGGLSSAGIQGDMWKLQLSTGQWVQLPLPSSLAGRAQRAQFGATSYSGGLGMVGGRHRATINAEAWLFRLPDEYFQVAPIQYHPYSWVQPNRAPYSSDLKIQKLIGTLTGPVTASTTLAGREVMIILGGYEQNMSMAFLYEYSRNELTPMYCDISGIYPTARSLTEGVVFGNKLFVSHGWSEDIEKNNPDVWSLSLECPGPTCGTWELHAIMSDGRDSLSSALYGENIIHAGGWGEIIVHNDLVLFHALKKNTSTVIHGDYYAPPARKFHSMCLIGNQMVIFGGLGNDQKAKADSFTLRLDEQLWSNKAAGSGAPTARYGHTAASIRLEMYAFGGRDENDLVYGDLSVYSLNSESWETYNQARFKPAIVDWPAARYFHTALSVNDRFIYIYGGIDEEGTFLTDLWRWDVSITRFVKVLPNHEDAPADQSNFYEYDNVVELTPIAHAKVMPLAQSAAVFLDNVLYFIGGQDVGFNPTSACYAYKLSTNVDEPGAWYAMPRLPQARNQHAATIMSGSIYAYGGLFYEAVSADLFMYNIQTSKWSRVDATQKSWNVPRPAAGGSMQAYGNSITMFGGSSAEFQDLHSSFFLLPEAWQYSGGAACTGENAMVNGEPCTECTPGTVTSLQWCIPCSEGYYWKFVNGKAECSPCLPGFAGAIRGASSFALCIPCANGTYASDAGSSSCTDCESDKYCPVGSRVQLDSRASELSDKSYQTQPKPYDSSVSKSVDDKTTIFTFLLVAVICVMATLYMVVTLANVKVSLEKLDTLYQFNHLQLSRKPMVRRQTSMGGICSLIAIALVFYLIIVLTLPFSMDNIIETRSLIPNVSTKEGLTFVGDLEAKVQLNGYPGACVVVGTSDTCVSGISVGVGESHFLNAPNATTRCENRSSSVMSSCHVTWTCTSCAVPIKDAVSFAFMSDDTFATSMDWSFSSSSGYPEISTSDQRSGVYGSVSSGDDQLFRGTTQPTMVELKLTQTYYVESYAAIERTGYHVNFVDRTLGDTTVPLTFYSSNGIRVAFALDLQLQTMNVARSLKQTTVQFIGSLLGSISGVIGGIAVVMSIAEDIEEFVFNRTKKHHGKGTRGHLEAILRENDQEIVEKARAQIAAGDRSQETHTQPDQPTNGTEIRTKRLVDDDITADQTKGQATSLLSTSCLHPSILTIPSPSSKGDRAKSSPYVHPFSPMQMNEEMRTIPEQHDAHDARSTQNGIRSSSPLNEVTLGISDPPAESAATPAAPSGFQTSPELPRDHVSPSHLNSSQSTPSPSYRLAGGTLSPMSEESVTPHRQMLPSLRYLESNLPPTSPVRRTSTLNTPTVTHAAAVPSPTRLGSWMYPAGSPPND